MINYKYNKIYPKQKRNSSYVNISSPNKYISFPNQIPIFAIFYRIWYDFSDFHIVGNMMMIQSISVLTSLVKGNVKKKKRTDLYYIISAGQMPQVHKRSKSSQLHK